jgi:hypothetical protein
LDTITLIRLIRAVFSLSPGQAKEVKIRAEGLAASLDQYQSRIADDLSEAVKRERQEQFRP